MKATIAVGDAVRPDARSVPLIGESRRQTLADAERDTIARTDKLVAPHRDPTDAGPHVDAAGADGDPDAAAAERDRAETAAEERDEAHGQRCRRPR